MFNKTNAKNHWLKFKYQKQLTWSSSMVHLSIISLFKVNQVPINCFRSYSQTFLNLRIYECIEKNPYLGTISQNFNNAKSIRPLTINQKRYNFKINLRSLIYILPFLSIHFWHRNKQETIQWKDKTIRTIDCPLMQ